MLCRIHRFLFHAILMFYIPFNSIFAKHTYTHSMYMYREFIHWKIILHPYVIPNKKKFACIGKRAYEHAQNGRIKFVSIMHTYTVSCPAFFTLMYALRICPVCMHIHTQNLHVYIHKERKKNGNIEIFKREKITNGSVCNYVMKANSC